MSDEIKKAMGENLALYPPREMVQAVFHSSVLVSYIFLEIQVKGGMKCPVGLKQVTTVARDPRSAY